MAESLLRRSIAKRKHIFDAFEVCDDDDDTTNKNWERPVRTLAFIAGNVYYSSDLSERRYRYPFCN